jgi:ATP-dependent helicase/nuclease subunit B
MEQELTNALDQGATIITANQRLARQLVTRYAALQQSSGAMVWETPDVLPWSAWIGRSWASWFDNAKGSDAGSPPALLSPEQEQALWEAVIRDCERDNALFDVHAAASLAHEAWSLWRAWRIPLERNQNTCGPDGQAFIKWAAAFESRCQAEHLVDNGRVADVVAEWLSAGRLTAPSRLRLAGFDELTPQQNAVLDALRERGCDVVMVAPSIPERGRARRISVCDAEQEMQLAARWARARLEQSPNARIGIVVPDLGALRDRISSVLEDIFHPDAIAPGAARKTYAYNISLGLPLEGYPVVHTALSVLDLSKHSISLAQAGDLLRSPFLKSGETECSRRALLDVKLRELGAGDVNRHKLAWLARTRNNHGTPLHYACPLLAEMLDAFDRAVKAFPSRQSPAGWVQSFTELLQTCGWPGERTLNSDEFQAVEAWGQALQSLAGLERIVPKMDLAEALAYLRQIVKGVFQPESVDAPVQVMGTLEASGATFDHLWLLGLHDEAWPAAARPNPLLPIGVQRTHHVPHGCAERELEYARNVTRRLLKSASEIVASYPQREGDHDLLPSPLIATVEEVQREQLCVYTGETWQTLIYQSAAIELLSDDCGPPLPAQAPGGVRLLEDQVACPFRAFAIHRLGARLIGEPGLGLDSMARGSLVHAAMEKLWSELQTHERLRATEENALRDMVRRAVNAAINDLPQRCGASQGDRFFAIEQGRLEMLLMGWLELEKKRAPFKVVAREEVKTLSIGGLSLQVRIDRIDELVDSGLRIVIDYKTSKPETPAWFGDCPEQPQLPCYSVYDDMGNKPAAVLLAHVRQGAMQYKGIAMQDALAPGVKALENSREGQAYGDGAWDALFRSWERSLEALAEAVSAGRAAIAPRRYPQTCEYCELPTLCRINEILAGSPESFAEDEDS